MFNIKGIQVVLTGFINLFRKRVVRYAVGKTTRTWWMTGGNSIGIGKLHRYSC